MTPSTCATIIMVVNLMVLMYTTSAAPLITEDQNTDKNTTNTTSEEPKSHHIEGNGATYKYSLLEEGLFEGDIKMSEEDIRQYYNLSSIPGGDKYYEMMSNEEERFQRNGTTTENLLRIINKRGATSGFLWTNAIIPYRFAHNVSNGVRHSIRKAMDYWEDHTCIRFVKYHGIQSDYVEFVRKTSGCWSNVGRVGGKQELNWNKDYKCDFGTMLHELGHTIGFFHEHNRPDRNQYVRINYENVKDDKRDQFARRYSYQVNSLGSEYDYASVMHYPTNKFSRNGRNTIEVNNHWAYHNQGSPDIGDWNDNRLSSQDIQQTRNLYSCSAFTGVQGLFYVRIRTGCNLPDTDPVWNSPDPYVRITAVDNYGSKFVKETRVISGTTSPDWNEDLVFTDRRWMFFRIQTWDSDSHFTGSDDKMSVSETRVISGGEYRYNIHCVNYCRGYVNFDYGIQDLTSARLSVHVRYAFGVQDTDGHHNDPDPYVVVQAISSNGPYTLRTNADDETEFPIWYSNLDFGCHRWANFIDIQIWDSDSGSGDDKLSDKERVTLETGHHYAKMHRAYGGANLIYDYSFIPC